MYYAKEISPGGAVSIFFSPPDLPYIEVEALPEGDGPLKFNRDGELIRLTPSPQFDDYENKGEDVYAEMAKAIQEGVNEV